MHLLTREFAFPDNPSQTEQESIEKSFCKYEEYYKKYVMIIVQNLFFYASALPVYDIAHCHELEKCINKYAQIIYLKTQGGENLTEQALR